jgi:hypothetical protein
MGSMLSALILVPAHFDLDLSGQLTVGDLIVGLGTLLLAAVPHTWRGTRSASAHKRTNLTGAPRHESANAANAKYVASPGS